LGFGVVAITALFLFIHFVGIGLIKDDVNEEIKSGEIQRFRENPVNIVVLTKKYSKPKVFSEISSMNIWY
jgi:hypothetical protein